MLRPVLALALGALGGCSDSPAEVEDTQQPFPLVAVGTSGMLCTESTARLRSGALMQICLKPGWWNGQLIVFAPGYRNPGLPSTSAGVPLLPETVTGLGYAFATTTFREDGLVVPSTWIEGDLLELVT